MTLTDTAMNARQCDMPWAIVQAGNQLLAVDTQHVKELVILPEVVAVPDTPPHVRGAINLRGRVLPLLDLRVLLGMTSAAQECEDLCLVLEQRERDHCAWLAELNACVCEGRKFTLATDPHQCAFGRWYDTFRTENLLAAGLLKKFEGPHIAIHEVAANALALISAGDKEGSLRVIETARQGVLKELVILFSRLRALLRETNREVALVLTDGVRCCSIAVDGVDAIERLESNSMTSLGSELMLARNCFARQVGRRSKGGGLVLLLESDRLLGDARS